jgi:hypothetical protein
MTTCPNCKKDLELSECKLEFHRTGRKGICPKCNKKFLLTRSAKNMVPDKNGVFRKKYKPKK